MIFNSPHFGAILKTTLQLPVNNSLENKQVDIYQLEPKDLPIVDRLKEQVEKEYDSFKKGHPHGFLPKDLPAGSKEQKSDIEWAYYVNILDAVDSTKRVLLHQENLSKARENQYPQTAVVYMAVCDAKPCGLLVGNMSKVRSDNTFTTSYRDKPKETELDCIATWPITTFSNRIKHIGQGLQRQFYLFCQTLTPKPDSIYIRSEIDQYSAATKFYRQMGAEPVSDKNIPFETPNAPVKVTTKLYDPGHKINDSPITPMVVHMKRAEIVTKQKQQELNAISVKDSESIGIENIVDLNYRFNPA